MIMMTMVGGGTVSTITVVTMAVAIVVMTGMPMIAGGVIVALPCARHSNRLLLPQCIVIYLDRDVADAGTKRVPSHRKNWLDVP